MKSSNIKKAIADRESDAQYRTNLFSISSSDSIILSISMAVPEGQRKLSIDPGTLDDSTSKPQIITARTQYINRFFQNKDGSSITNKFESVSHQLTPFITDPIIAANVEPKSGSNSVLIGAPFLDKRDLEFESGLYAKRPGLEFILRIKLREQNLADQLQISGAVNQVIPTLLKTTTLVKTPTGMIELGINEEDATRLFELGFVDFNTINDLLKTYKGLINLYNKSINSIQEVGNKIMWIPSPGKGGPESGSVVSASFIVPKNNKYLDNWEIEKRISSLNIKALLAKYQSDIGKNNDGSSLVYGDFSISEYQNVAATFDTDASNENSKRTYLETQGSDALRTIELIGGEISGLGLVDIVAIYMALWSLKTPILLGLIDDAAATRLNNIPELRNADTQNRVSDNPISPISAYTALASTISDILAFGDYILSRLRGSPKEGGTGDVVRNNG